MRQVNLIFNSNVLRFAERAHGVVVSHPLRMRKALGSIPSVSICVETHNCSAGRAGTSQQTRPQLRAPKATPRGFCADRVILSSLSTNSADRNSTRVFRVTSANAKQNVIADDVVWKHLAPIVRILCSWCAWCIRETQRAYTVKPMSYMFGMAIWFLFRWRAPRLDDTQRA